MPIMHKGIYMNIHTIASHLNEVSDSTTGLTFDCLPVVGEVDVLQVTVTNREELPIFVSITDSQLLCICYLWGTDEVKSESVNDMHVAMLELNTPMPLSSFSKIDNKYVLFGAMSTSASINDIEHEISVLSANALDVIENLGNYLI